jgi:hypothetical protein
METNKQLLIDIANKLNDSTKKNWDTGDVSQWAKFGRKMWNTIDAVTPMIRTIAGAKITETNENPTKKEQKIVISHLQHEINELIDKGWTVVSITPQHVSTASSATAKGEFCFLLEK